MLQIGMSNQQNYQLLAISDNKIVIGNRKTMNSLINNCHYQARKINFK